MAKTAAKKRYDSKGRVLNVGEQQRADKRYLYSYKHENGKAKYIYAKDLLELRQEEKRIQIKQDKNIKISEGNKTRTDWVTIWLESVKPKVRITTFSGYSDNSRLHILSDKISSMKIEDIYKADVQEFYKRLVDKGLSGGTITIIHNIICMIFTYAVDLNVLEKNYASGAMKNYISGKTTKNIIALTVDEQNRLIECLLYNKSTESCKTKLEKVASPFWRKLQKLSGTGCAYW